MTQHEASTPPAPAPRERAASPLPQDEVSRWNRVRESVRGERARLQERHDRINERSGRNLGFAVLIGCLIGAALLLSLLIAKPFFNLFGIATVALASAELAGALRGAGRDIPRIPTVVFGSLVVPIAYFMGPSAQWLALLGAIVGTSLWRVAEAAVANRKPSSGEVWKDLLAGAFIHLYAVFLGSFTVLLAAQPHGEFWVLGFIIPVVAIDTGAYATGITFGKTKLAPSISGGKTWEGLAGAAVWGTVASVLVCQFMIGLPWWHGLFIGPLLLVSATLGDLFESMVKRDLGIKDMSGWLPGHGGVLDRIDSILPSGAVMFGVYVALGHLVN